MNGYVAQRRGRFYAVIYEGLDPVTGRERRTWHPAGTDRAAAERLAAQLAKDEQGRADAVRALTFGAYLSGQWLPAKKLRLAASTYRGYERNVHRHVLPTLGRIGLRRLRHHQIEALYDRLLTPSRAAGAAPKTVYEIHLVIRGALDDAAAPRARDPQRRPHRPRTQEQRRCTTTEAQSWTDERAPPVPARRRPATDCFPLLWLAGDDRDAPQRGPRAQMARHRLQQAATLTQPGLVAIGYEVHQTRGKTNNARRNIALDDTTLTVLDGWRALQPAEFAAVGIDTTGGSSPTATANPSTHTPSPRLSSGSPAAPASRIRLHDLRHTHGTLLIKAGVPVKVVSERLGHANIAFTIQTYQHVLPGMQADAASVYERLTTPVPPARAETEERRGNTRRKTA